MGLVIEEMRDDEPHRILSLGWIDDGHESQRAIHVFLLKRGYPAGNGGIGSLSLRSKLREIGVELLRERAYDKGLAGESPHPDSIAEQQVIERAVHGLE